MPDTLADRARRVIVLAQTMRMASQPPYLDTEAFMRAAEEWGKLIASGLPEELCREYLRFIDLENTTTGSSDVDLRMRTRKRV